jgi:hypothetical protein
MQNSEGGRGLRSLRQGYIRILSRTCSTAVSQSDNGEWLSARICQPEGERLLLLWLTFLLTAMPQSPKRSPMTTFMSLDFW